VSSEIKVSPIETVATSIFKIVAFI